jgi:bifunctional enzyme CysN/CysC
LTLRGQPLDGLPRGAGEEVAAAVPHVRQRGRRQVHAHRSLLYDSHSSSRTTSRRWRRTRRSTAPRGGLDFALLVDGLEAEREQGITIDVAYRFFTTDKRKFIVADTPGHEQYTRNMATGASTSELAVILVDARKGVLVQTRRHAHIASLLGIKHVVLAVNKIDLVDYSQDVYESIVRDFEAFARARLRDERAIPMRRGLATTSTREATSTPWYSGPVADGAPRGRGRRHRSGERARFACPCSGSTVPTSTSAASPAPSPREGSPRAIRSSSHSPGARAAFVASSPRTATSRGGYGGGHHVVLEDEIDVSCGDILVAPEGRPEVSDQFAAHVLWMTEEELFPGRQYLLKCAARTVPAQVTSLKHKVDVNTFEPPGREDPAIERDRQCQFRARRAHRVRPYRETATRAASS